MNYLRDEKVISIKEWIYAIFSKWRSIFVVSLITFIVVLSANIVGAIPYFEILSKSIIISAIIKQVILFTVLSMFAMIFIYAIRFVFSDVVKTETELKMTFNAEVLGDISESIYKKNLWIDKKLKSYIGVKLSDSADKATERVANVIKAKKNLGNSEKAKIAVVSSVSNEYAEKCVTRLKKHIKDDMDLIVAGDIMTSPEAVSVVNDVHYIILAEGINCSKYGVMNDTCNQIDKWNKSILGIVLVD